VSSIVGGAASISLAILILIRIFNSRKENQNKLRTKMKTADDSSKFGLRLAGVYEAKTIEEPLLIDDTHSKRY
jgi:hypothetical protein